jgi:hypothetical protein
MKVSLLGWKKNRYINRIVFWSGVKENLKVGLPVKEILQMIFFLAFTGKFNR